jgi:hypothetical protein
MLFRSLSQGLKAGAPPLRLPGWFKTDEVPLRFKQVDKCFHFDIFLSLPKKMPWPNGLTLRPALGDFVLRMCPYGWTGLRCLCRG